MDLTPECRKVRISWPPLRLGCLGSWDGSNHSDVGKSHPLSQGIKCFILGNASQLGSGWDYRRRCVLPFLPILISIRFPHRTRIELQEIFNECV